MIQALGLGETIGYTAKLTQNNNGLYETQINSAQHRTHIALMGDPTLRLHRVAPPSKLESRKSGTQSVLTWSPSPDAGATYHVYGAAGPAGPFTRLTEAPIAERTFTAPMSNSGNFAARARASSTAR